jgi:hypothetical protein
MCIAQGKALRDAWFKIPLVTQEDLTLMLHFRQVIAQEDAGKTKGHRFLQITDEMNVIEATPLN